MASDSFCPYLQLESPFQRAGQVGFLWGVITIAMLCSAEVRCRAEGLGDRNSLVPQGRVFTGALVRKGRL